ncbi:unnamed protein product [Calypogeia fissa]
MPAAALVIRSLKSFKSFKSQQLNSLQQSYNKAVLHHVTNLRLVGRRKFAVPQAEQKQQCITTKVGINLDKFPFSRSPPTPNGKKVTTHYFFSLDDRLIPLTEKPFLSTMEERNGKVSIGEKLKKGDPKLQEEEEKMKLQKEEEEKKKKEKAMEEERNRVKEQEMEDKIGPPPEKPLAGDCCGQGCEVCVWDTYWDELDIYKKLRKAAEEEEKSG